MLVEEGKKILRIGLAKIELKTSELRMFHRMLIGLGMPGFIVLYSLGGNGNIFYLVLSPSTRAIIFLYVFMFDGAPCGLVARTMQHDCSTVWLTGWALATEVPHNRAEVVTVGTWCRRTDYLSLWFRRALVV